MYCSVLRIRLPRRPQRSTLAVMVDLLMFSIFKPTNNQTTGEQHYMRSDGYM